MRLVDLFWSQFKAVTVTSCLITGLYNDLKKEHHIFLGRTEKNIPRFLQNIWIKRREPTALSLRM